MTTQTKRTTVYLDPELHLALRLKAIAVSRSVSDLVNDSLRETMAEDADDIQAFEARVTEPSITYDELIRRLKVDGQI